MGKPEQQNNSINPVNKHFCNDIEFDMTSSRIRR